MCDHPHCTRLRAGVYARLRSAEYCSASCRSRHGAILRQQRRRAEGLDSQRNRARRLERKYGLTVARWHEMLVRQSGLCAVCSEQLAGKVCVDHCHLTLRVRGLLCDRCNQGLGYFADDPGRLTAAAQYLEAASRQPQ